MIPNTQEPGAFSKLLVVFSGAEVIIQTLIHLSTKQGLTSSAPLAEVSWRDSTRFRTPLEPALEPWGTLPHHGQCMQPFRSQQMIRYLLFKLSQQD